MVLCSRILGKRRCYPNPIPFFIWMLLFSRCCCVAESWANGVVTLSLFLFFIWMLLCSRWCCVAESQVNGAVTLTPFLLFIWMLLCSRCCCVAESLVNGVVILTPFLLFMDVVVQQMLLCSRILGKRCCYPNPIPFFYLDVVVQQNPG